MLWVGVGAEAAWVGQVLSRRPDGGAWFLPLGQPALQAVGTVHAALLSERTELRDALHRVRAHHANFLGQLDACFRQQVVTDIFTD